MPESNKETVLVTGGSGFLGQHIIKLLIQEKDNLGIKEIRSVDLKPYKNIIGHQESECLKTFIGDICKQETVKKFFMNVDCVFHCAAYISLQYPADYKELERINYDGTNNIVDMCIRNNIPRLIYTSCASVNFVPYMGHSTFSIIINQTESKARTPIYDLQKSFSNFDKEFFIQGYSSSKLRAENSVLHSTGASLLNGNDYLQTVALRPPIMYGEGDNHFMPPVLNYGSKHNYQLPRVGGYGGKHQLVYVGNVAWGHICAYKTLKTSPKKIAGLPVFVTDDTPINDINRFITRLGAETETLRFTISRWYIPHFLFFFFAFLIETFVRIFYPILGIKLKYSLRTIAAFTSSVIMFNRMRASIHMDYEPIYDEKSTMRTSGLWYEKWANENCRKKGKD